MTSRMLLKRDIRKNDEKHLFINVARNCESNWTKNPDRSRWLTYTYHNSSMAKLSRQCVRVEPVSGPWINLRWE